MVHLISSKDQRSNRSSKRDFGGSLFEMTFGAVSKKMVLESMNQFVISYS